MQTVTVTMTKGIPTITVTGVKGKACKALTKELEEDLGAVTKETNTREFSEAPQAQGAERRAK